MSLLRKENIFAVGKNILFMYFVLCTFCSWFVAVMVEKFYGVDGVTADKVGIYLLKVSNRDTRTRCEICSKLTIKTSERHHWRCSGVFIVNFEHIS